jgi:hypothetical protein
MWPRSSLLDRRKAERRVPDSLHDFWKRSKRFFNRIRGSPCSDHGANIFGRDSDLGLNLCIVRSVVCPMLRESLSLRHGVSVPEPGQALSTFQNQNESVC